MLNLIHYMKHCIYISHWIHLKELVNNFPRLYPSKSIISIWLKYELSLANSTLDFSYYWQYLSHWIKHNRMNSERKMVLTCVLQDRCRFRPPTQPKPPSFLFEKHCMIYNVVFHEKNVWKSLRIPKNPRQLPRISYHLYNQMKPSPSPPLPPPPLTPKKIRRRRRRKNCKEL